MSTTANVTVTPGVYEMVMAMFAPDVTAGGNQVVTPSTASLTLTTYAPAGGATGVVEYPGKIYDINGNLYWRVTSTKYMKV